VTSSEGYMVELASSCAQFTYVSHFSPGANTRLLPEVWTIIQFFLCLFCSSHWISFPGTETWDGLTISFENLQYLTHFSSNCMEEYFHPASLPHNSQHLQ
jgi:hypothetical protein